MLLDGRDLLTLDQAPLREARRNIGMIFQEFNLIERLSVLDNVLTGRLGYTGTLRSVIRRFTGEDIGRPSRCSIASAWASMSTNAPIASPAASGSGSA